MYHKLGPGLWLDTESNEIIQAKSRHGRYSKVIVSVCILLAVAYTAACLVMQWRTGQQPEPQLTVTFLGFIAGELWNLSKIKREKQKKEGEQDE